MTIRISNSEALLVELNAYARFGIRHARHAATIIMQENVAGFTRSMNKKMIKQTKDKKKIVAWRVAACLVSVKTLLSL